MQASGIAHASVLRIAWRIIEKAGQKRRPLAKPDVQAPVLAATDVKRFKRAVADALPDPLSADTETS